MPEIQDYKNSWINFPRKLISYYRNGNISLGAYLSYLHIRINANAYGITTVTLESINSDVFKNKVTVNSVNKYLLELKNQKLIWFHNRRGSRGSFEILNDEFFQPDGKITNIAKRFEPTNEELAEEITVSAAELENEIQNVKEDVTGSVTSSNTNKKPAAFRTNNTDTDTEKDILNIDRSCKSEKYRCTNPVIGFNPKGQNEYLLLEMAKKLGEGCMDFMLKHNREGKFWALEKAFEDFREISLTQTIHNPPAWFNKRVNNILAEKNNV